MFTFNSLNELLFLFFFLLLLFLGPILKIEYTQTLNPYIKIRNSTITFIFKKEITRYRVTPKVNKVSYTFQFHPLSFLVSDTNPYLYCKKKNLNLNLNKTVIIK